jgi:hypothetical protein
MPEMVLQSEDVMHPVCNDRNNAVFERMESKQPKWSLSSLPTKVATSLVLSSSSTAA